MKEFIKKHKMSLFIIISSLVMLIGLSYAWLQLTLRGEKNLTLKAGTLQLVLDESMSEGIMMENAVPIREEEGITTPGYTFALENRGTVDSAYTIYLDDFDIPEESIRMQDSFIRYQLTKNDQVIATDLLSTLGDNPNRILDSGYINASQKYIYTLKMWIDFDVGNEVMGTIFKGNLRVEAIQDAKNLLYRRVATQAVPDDEKSEFVTGNSGIDFSKIPSDTNGKGVYTLASTKNDKFPVHYFRGNVTNNNVSFAGFCWKIVRTTSTGGVKMIYNGKPDDNGACSTQTGETTGIGFSKFNEIGGYSPSGVGYMYGTVMSHLVKDVSNIDKDKDWVYGNDIEWDGEKYILKDTTVSNTTNWATDSAMLADRYRYTCFSTESSCAQVGYIHYFRSAAAVYHFLLSNGQTLDSIKEEMFTNTTDSTVKGIIDEWYQDNMITYTEKLEDTIWCNDRTIDRGPLKSKDEDLSIDANVYTNFGAEKRTLVDYKPSIICPNDRDKFTVSKENGNGALIYPVALLTADEISLAGYGSSSVYLNTNQHYWSMSPRGFDYALANVFGVYESSGFSSYYVTRNDVMVRPSVSLAPGTTINGGDGTKEKPFKVESTK